MIENRSKKILSAVIILIILTVLHSTIGNNLISFAPLAFTLSITIAQLIKNKFKVLLVMALIAELFSFFPLGIMTAIVMTPWLVKRLTYKIQPDLSLYFLGIITLTVTIQSGLAFGYEIIYLLIQNHINMSQINDFIPYATIMMIIGVSTLIVSTVCIAWRELFPLHTSGSASFLRKN